MQIHNTENPQFYLDAHVKPEMKEIVMGLHWDPPEDSTKTDPDDLDAVCVLFDRQQHVLELIHPGHPRNANSSVVHTGDSQTGASKWDDERIFVFLEALPKVVSALGFIVSSAQGRAVNEVHGASCHISDRVTEHAWVQLELTTLKGCVACCVATLRRCATGWAISTDAQLLNQDVLAALLSLVKDVKTQKHQPQPSATE